MSYVIKVVGRNENQLLNRKELNLEITHTNQGTPNKAVVVSELSKNYSVPSNQIYVYDLGTKKGLHRSIAKANIYENMDDLKNIEREFVLAKITGEKKQKIMRRAKKEMRIKKYNTFGTHKRNMKKAARKSKDD